MTNPENLWIKAVMKKEATIAEAIQRLNEAGLKILLVTEDDGRLVGTISDGDIRRGLLRGLVLSSEIENIIHKDAMVVPIDMSRDVVIQIMTANKIQQVPIVDEENRVIGLHLWDELNTKKQRDNFMVIMAGGKGSRLYPQTENCPKPLLLIAGKPILEHIIDRAKKEGFFRFVIAIYHLGHMIEDYFGDGKRFGVQIEYLREQEPLGTAGALVLFKGRPKSPFIVTNGDVVSDIHYSELIDFHNQHDAFATMAVRRYESQNPFGVVQTDGIEITHYEEKPITINYINAGVYVLEPGAIDQLIISERKDMPTLFQELSDKSERVIAYPIHEQWLDIGNPNDFQTALNMESISKSKDLK
jgi:dTDP-glucose pyrophosphorylase